MKIFSDRSIKKALEILSKMTLKEKIGQLTLNGFGETEVLGVKGNESNWLTEKIREGKIGCIIHGPADFSFVTRKMQEIAVNESRLGIPLLFNSDVIHGFETIFPMSIAASCSFDTALVEKSAEIASKEAGVTGINYVNSPMVDVSRDARWGRIAESQGEDPYLAGEMAKAYVRGFQKGDKGMAATLKHYAGYGSCEGGRDYNVSEMSENTMLNCFLIPFREGVKAGARSVMSSFNSIENVPATGSKKYLKDILRGKFGFNGVVVSDACSVNEMMGFGYCADKKDCAYRAVKAGLDIEMGTDCYENNLEDLVRFGDITEEEIDELVLRVLSLKAELGLFDDPYKYFSEDKSCIFCPEHLKVSEKLASESAVLLENNGVLPMKKGTKIALVGKFSESRDFLGCWQFSQKKEEVKTLKEGLTSFDIKGVSNGYNLTAAEVASSNADVVIFTIGQASEDSGEAKSSFNLEVEEDAKRCYDYLLARGKKVVVLVFAGRPLILNRFKRADALMYCWELGHRTAEAIDKLLSGEVSPSGKLTVSFPRHVGQIPLNYNYKQVGRPFLSKDQSMPFQTRYVDGDNFPQYSFGYGLSYGKFVYGKPSLKTTEDGAGQITVRIKNVGNMGATEIAELYITDPVAEVAHANIELKGFKRVRINKGEEKEVTFKINKDLLAYYHSDGEFSADDGQFIAYVGNNLADLQSVTFNLKNGKVVR